MKKAKLNLSTKIVEDIKAMIFSGELAPGQQIVQEEFARRLGVSRTPLLHALQILMNEMLVVSIPNRGMFVRKLTPRELKEMFEFREAVEAAACRLAAEYITPDQVRQLRELFKPFLKKPETVSLLEYQIADRHFHQFLITISGNEVFQRMMTLGNVLLTVYQQGLLRQPSETLPEHLAIIDALEEGNGPKAEKHMRRHLDMSVKRMARSFENKEGKLKPEFFQLTAQG